jgi:hypothetical protein
MLATCSHHEYRPHMGLPVRTSLGLPNTRCPTSARRGEGLGNHAQMELPAGASTRTGSNTWTSRMGSGARSRRGSANSRPDSRPRIYACCASNRSGLVVSSPPVQLCLGPRDRRGDP